MNFDERLYALIGEDHVKTKEPMKEHTTFRVGGPAAWFVTPADVEQLSGTVRLCKEEGMPFYILGHGSNLLVSDEGYDGVVIAMGEPWGWCRVKESVITAGAGILLSRLARTAMEAGLSGLEFAAGIPGSLGGAVVMNAGAYGSEMREVLTGARVLTDEGEVLDLTAGELHLGYRASCIPGNRYIVLQATMELKPGDPAAIRTVMESLGEKRRCRQPLNYPSAGSTFKRPEGYFAGKLIQDSGLAGFSVGGAQVSEKHCGFVINRGDATARDIYRLCQEVKERVMGRFGVELEMEVRTLGHF